MSGYIGATPTTLKNLSGTTHVVHNYCREEQAARHYNTSGQGRNYAGATEGVEGSTITRMK